MSFKQRCIRAIALSALLAVANGQVICSSQPPILPRTLDYSKNCDNPEQQKTPCFTQISGSLFGATILPTSDDITGHSLLLAKNADLTEFTPADQKTPFTIRYEYAGISLHYGPTDKLVCRKLRIEKWDAERNYSMAVLSGTDDSYFFFYGGDAR
ncbi:related to Mig1 protein [Sporisorium scitamineum]|uniref:Related to Mig1 protein n=1 Tax=Sporisorium scitamineum TaxID=49012 RepID=A0A0F7SAY5_9BASI|nr:related to Mig1 protein [Sporisorium scitamineum]CDW97873.1 hypothetical protein [Sporisorium scitamineum]